MNADEITVDDDGDFWKKGMISFFCIVNWAFLYCFVRMSVLWIFQVGILSQEKSFCHNWPHVKTVLWLCAVNGADHNVLPFMPSVNVFL